MDPLAPVASLIPLARVRLAPRNSSSRVIPPQLRPHRPRCRRSAGVRCCEAFRRIPLPASRSVSQPGNKTLVNFDTIFYTQAQGFRRDIALLGRRITLDITPAQYTWHFGDGTSMTTDQPGAPYPDKSIVHRYPKAHLTVAHHVTVIWGARFRVDGGPWREPCPARPPPTGRLTDLRIAEATPVLTGDY